jgi:hypothetical protein
MFNKLIVFASALMLACASSAIAGNGSGTGEITSQLTEDEEYYLVYMRLEEKLARDAYITLDGSWGTETEVFLNISESEQQHTDTVEKLLDKYGIPDPVVDEGPDSVGDFSDYEKFQNLFNELIGEGMLSLTDAFIVGAKIEEKDMVDIKKAIDATDNTDITNAYENLLCGSRNHLRAFVANIETQGVTYYPPLYFDDLTEEEEIALRDELFEILDNPMERCGN